MDNRPIGVFDSGIGGVMVLKELKKKMPNERYIYLADTLNFPYGEKRKEEIIGYTKNNINTLLKENVKLVIIACGTATSQALEIVKNEFNIPIIGIIEPTIDYIENLNIEKIGVIATSGTIRSGAWEYNIKSKNPNMKVINQACPLLASIAEEGKAKSKESLEAIHKYMQIFKDEKVDTIILGCTHYPIYNEIIRNEFYYKINLINTGMAVAVETQNLLEQLDMQNVTTHLNDKFILTKEEKNFIEKVNNIFAL